MLLVTGKPFLAKSMCRTISVMQNSVALFPT